MSLSEIQPRRTAHTLFVDFVGYSRLSTDSQAAVQVALQNLVYNLPAFTAARNDGQLMVRKTGDGMAIVFFQDVEFPLAAAVALDEVLKHQATSLRDQVGANFRLRMGVHSGPVVIVDEDGDGIMDVAGEGINTAQRVMDCGDQGHILVSGPVFNLVEEKPHWKSLLHDLGIVRVKHDELVHLYNLHGIRPDGTTIGYEALPRKVYESRERAREQAEQEATRTQEENRSAVTGYALRAALLVGALVLLGSLLFMIWRHSTLDSKEVQHVADVIRKNKEEKDRKNQPPTPEPKPIVVATPTPGPASTGPETNAMVEADVPNIVGMPRADAEKALAAVKLTLALSEKSPEVQNPTVAPGTVLSQFPIPGKQFVRGGTVYVSLAVGGQVAPTPAPAGEQSAFTGVLVDARSFPQLANSTSIGLFGPNDVALYSSSGATSDELQAIQAVGINPLRITAQQAGAQGVGLSAEDVEKLRTLPDSVRAKTVVLRL